METLLACPFCREHFTQSEGRDCPHCGVKLVLSHSLPLSHEEREARALELEATPPQDRLLPWTFSKRGRGLLAALALLGLSAFFSPWIALSRPNQDILTGFDLARRLFWLWGGAAAWFTTLPLVLTRRTVTDMRGARLILTLLSGLTASEVTILLLNAPTSNGPVPIAYHWAPGIFASLLISALGIIVSCRFGGGVADFPADFGKPRKLRLPAESSTGETLH